MGELSRIAALIMIVRNGMCYAENPEPVLKITVFGNCGNHQM